MLGKMKLFDFDTILQDKSKQLVKHLKHAYKSFNSDKSKEEFCVVDSSFEKISYRFAREEIIYYLNNPLTKQIDTMKKFAIGLFVVDYYKPIFHKNNIDTNYAFKINFIFAMIFCCRLCNEKEKDNIKSIISNETISKRIKNLLLSHSNTANITCIFLNAIEDLTVENNELQAKLEQVKEAVH